MLILAKPDYATKHKSQQASAGTQCVLFLLRFACTQAELKCSQVGICGIEGFSLGCRSGKWKTHGTHLCSAGDALARQQRAGFSVSRSLA